MTFGADGNAEDARVRQRTDPPVQVRLHLPDRQVLTAWGSGRQIEFDPFLRCVPDEPCETTLTVDLAWADGRPETTFDAAWTLDLASVDASGSSGPIDATVTRIEPVHVATATASGTFDQPGVGDQPQVAFTVDAPLPSNGGVDTRVPTGVKATVTATSVGTTPLPSDAVISVFAGGRFGEGLPANVMMGPGETASLAFELIATCGTGGTCAGSGNLGAGIFSPNRNTTNVEGMAIRVEWSITAGIGTTHAGTAVITVEPQPTPRP